MERETMGVREQIKCNIMLALERECDPQFLSLLGDIQESLSCIWQRNTGDFQDLFLQRNEDRDRWQRSGAKK